MLDIKTAEEAYKKIKAHVDDDPKGIKMLTIQLAAALKSQELYDSKGIDLEIFVDTMKCFSRFCRDSFATYGDFRFDCCWWTYRQLSLNLFRLGELEFEMCADKLSVHIPSDANMTRAGLDASYDWAKRFFAKHFPEYEYDGIYCNTWLLAPSLREMLPAGSRILNFMDDYEILSEDKEAMNCMLWVYKKKYQDYESLPEETSLQRAIKARLLAGKKVGSAYGRVVRKD